MSDVKKRSSYTRKKRKDKQTFGTCSQRIHTVRNPLESLWKDISNLGLLWTCLTDSAGNDEEVKTVAG